MLSSEVGVVVVAIMILNVFWRRLQTINILMMVLSKEHH